MKSRDAKRRRQRRRERWKTTIGLISKRATLHVQHTIFCTFLCRCFPRLQRETSRNFLVTRFLQGMSHVLSFIFFFTAAHFHLSWWPLAFLIFSSPLQNFHGVLPTKKMSPLFFTLALDLCHPFFSMTFAGLPPTFSFSLSFSFSIFQICGHDN